MILIKQAYSVYWAGTHVAGQATHAPAVHILTRDQAPASISPLHVEPVD